MATSNKINNFRVTSMEASMKAGPDDFLASTPPKGGKPESWKPPHRNVTPKPYSNLSARKAPR